MQVRGPEDRRQRNPNTKPTVAELPDLGPILDAVTAAYGVTRTASYALHEMNGGTDGGDDEVFALIALRQGVTALGVAVDQLRDAEDLVRDFLENVGGAS